MRAAPSVQPSTQALERLIVIGAGAVGGSIGALVQRAGHAVVLVARGAHGEALRRDGLRLALPEGRSCSAVPSVARADEIEWGLGDVALLATKLQDAERALDEVRAAAGDVPVVCATNGVHGERFAAARFGTVLSTLVWMPATHLVPGEVRLHAAPPRGVLDTGPHAAPPRGVLDTGPHAAPARGVLDTGPHAAPARGVLDTGPHAAPPRGVLDTGPHAAPPRGVLDTGPHMGRAAGALADALCALFRAAGFDALPRADIVRWKHAKWIANLGNTAQALVEDDWRAVAAAARAEGEAVLEGAGLARVTRDELLARVAAVRELPVDGRAREGGSTWQSRARGRSLESPWLEGALAELAREVGVPAPVNAFLARAAVDPRPLRAAEVLANGS